MTFLLAFAKLAGYSHYEKLGERSEISKSEWVKPIRGQNWTAELQHRSILSKAIPVTCQYWPPVLFVYNFYVLSVTMWISPRNSRFLPHLKDIWVDGFISHSILLFVCRWEVACVRVCVILRGLWEDIFKYGVCVTVCLKVDVDLGTNHPPTTRPEFTIIPQITAPSIQDVN